MTTSLINVLHPRVTVKKHVTLARASHRKEARNHASLVTWSISITPWVIWSRKDKKVILKACFRICHNPICVMVGSRLLSISRQVFFSPDEIYFHFPAKVLFIGSCSFCSSSYFRLDIHLFKDSNTTAFIADENRMVLVRR